MGARCASVANTLPRRWLFGLLISRFSLPLWPPGHLYPSLIVNAILGIRVPSKSAILVLRICSPYPRSSCSLFSSNAGHQPCAPSLAT
ncbi:hypothetical protein PYCCODRAFT_1104708 [Trametes coccinea BRFM310]|uniref:Uncharacterized protein n=1 Tax=Trametes coccinea (strain BRFM310) TaxID=1353009 RepID=A0A1Y2I9I3_TRAC3|nr:hypothetical protein PYCCODRAFT_1104708 [Trametes coccinea BRFM310]